MYSTKERRIIFMTSASCYDYCIKYEAFAIDTCIGISLVVIHVDTE
jgi:hypothetical protein